LRLQRKLKKTNNKLKHTFDLRVNPSWFLHLFENYYHKIASSVVNKYTLNIFKKKLKLNTKAILLTTIFLGDIPSLYPAVLVYQMKNKNQGRLGVIRKWIDK